MLRIFSTADEEHMLSVHRAKEWEIIFLERVLNLFQHAGEEENTLPLDAMNTVIGSFAAESRQILSHYKILSRSLPPHLPPTLKLCLSHS